MKRLRSRERSSARADGGDAPVEHDWREHLDLLDIDHAGLDEVWDMAGSDAAVWDMSGDVIRRALGLEHAQPSTPPVAEAPDEATAEVTTDDTAADAAVGATNESADPTDESLTWLESVPAATTTSELAAFISDGETAVRPTLDDAPTWLVPIEELAEATGTTASSTPSAPVVPDLEIDWDAVATVPRVTSRRSARRWERRIQAENERRAAETADMSDTDLAHLREVLDESTAPQDRRSA